jgi:hypothetical protein
MKAGTLFAYASPFFHLNHPAQSLNPLAAILYYNPSNSCFLCFILHHCRHNSGDNKMLQRVLNFGFWSFEFVSDFGFSISDFGCG